MASWLKLLLCFFCTFCCCVSGCRGFDVSRADIADAWQSSRFNSHGCFRNASARPGQWDYFHSSGTPDPSGYQWLLLKLTRCVRVRSVTVHGRPEAPAAERVRAHGIEFLLSDKKPAGLTENPFTCTASFNHSLTGFHLCGVAKNSSSSDLAYEATCSVRDYSKLTQFVLLRKFVANETDKYMNFRLLEIEEDKEDVFNRISNSIYDRGDRNESACYRAYFCKQEKAICSVRELSHLKQNEKLLIRAWRPCKSTDSDAPNCSIRMRNGDVMALSIKVKTPSFLILSEFSVTSEMHGATLQCRHSCSDDGAHGETSQVLRMSVCESVETLPSASLNLNVTKHWVVGQTAVFKFRTEGSIALPKHECYLQYYQEETNEQIIRDHRFDFNASLSRTAVDVPLQKLNSSSNSENLNKISGFDLETFFEVPVLSVYHEGKIFCGIECNGHKIAAVSQRIPQLLEPCNTRFLLPPNSSWIDGTTVSLTTDTPNCSWVPISHSCFVESEWNGNKKLQKLLSTNSSSTFSVPVSRHWGSSASVACLVNQSGLIKTWARHPLPSVLYPVQSASIRLAAPQIRPNSPALFLLLASDCGNPPAEHSCSVAGRNLTQLMPPSNLNASSLWTLNALAGDDGQKIHCEIIQRTEDKSIVFNKSVSSGKLDVIYAPNNSWTATQPQVMKEAELISFSVNSVGGNPEPSHRCWLRTADGREVELASISSIQPGQKDRREKLLETQFSTNSTRQMNRGTVLCQVSQEPVKDLVRIFRQKMTVYYSIGSALVSLSSRQIRNGSEVEVELLASDRGNPPAQHFCHLAGRDLRKTQRPSQSNASSLWTFEALASHNGMWIRCQIVQVAASGSTVFNLSVSSDSLSVLYESKNSWTATQPLVMKEGESLSVSVKSIGGNPEPSHRCWLQTADHRNISMTGIREPHSGQMNRRQKLLQSKFSANSTRRLNGGSVMCSVYQGGLADLESFWQNITVYYLSDPPNIAGLPSSVYEGNGMNFSVSSGDGNPRVTHSCSAGHQQLTKIRTIETSSGLLTRMSFKPDRHHSLSGVQCSAVQVRDSKALFISSSTQNITVKFMADNTLAVISSAGITEGSALNIALVSVGGRPAVRNLSCWVGDIRLPACDSSAVSKSAGRSEQRCSIKTSRMHNKKSLSCKFEQDEILTEWKNRSLNVYFPSNSISWSGQLLSGSHLNLTLQTEEGNPSPELHCSLRSETVSIARLTLIPEPDLIGSYGGWVRRARLSHRFTEQQPEVTVACRISQTPFPPAENTKTLRAVFPSARGSSPSFGSGVMIIAAICCSLAVAAALCCAATSAALKRTRTAATASRCEAVELPAADEKPADPNAVYYYTED